MSANTLDIALSYIARGIAVIPVPCASKNPGRTGWQNLRIDASTAHNHFNGQRQNVGGLMGAPSNNQVDVDLDAAEAVRLASRFLDPTEAVFGRPSKRQSHWIYIADPITETQKFKDPTDGQSIVELRSTGTQTLLPGSTHPSGEPIGWDEDGEPAVISGPVLAGQVKRLAAAALLAKHWPTVGSRHDAALALGGGLLRAGWDAESVEAFIESVAWAAGDDDVEDRVDTVSYTADRIAADKPATGWPSLAKLVGERVVDALCDWLDIDAQEAVAFAVGTTRSIPTATAPTSHSYPAPLDSAAFYGLAGEIVRCIEPATEADPVALLADLVAAVGNIVGPGPHWRVSGRDHPLRVWPVLVGDTAVGRKGTARGSITPFLKRAAPDWWQQCTASGLSSGEGLIWRVRDEIRKSEPAKEKGRIVSYDEVVTDPGIADKRLLVTEEEFASVIKMMGREGSSLSTTLRQAWDDGELKTLTKNSPTAATGAHITVVGHITKDELLRDLGSTEAANGFANRHLWLSVRRSKVLPDGGDVAPAVIEDYGAQLAAVIANAAHIGLITRDDEANEMWRTVYGPLTEGGVGLLGAILARGSAQVMRLASIYAVLDETNRITADHLQAALAIWDYSEASCRYIFGDRMGDPDADTILGALRRSGGMSQTDISNLFGRNLSAARIERALSVLLTAGKVRGDTERTKGRPVTIWRAT